MAVGAAYVDSTGEPPFIRQVFEEHGPAAERTGARLLTAFGYDYVPGNLAAGLALREAREQGRPARRVEVGYFISGSGQVSAGTRASAVGMLTAPSMEFRHGELRPAALATRVVSFDVGGGRRWDALAVGASEHLTLPSLEPELREVGTYLGWAGRWTRAVAGGARAFNAVTRLPGARSVVAAVTRRLVGDSDGSGPAQEASQSAGTLVVAIAYDSAGAPVSRVRVTGPAPYPLTGSLLTWAAGRLVQSGATAGVAAGARGPVDAFGLDDLTAGCADLGLIRVE